MEENILILVKCFVLLFDFNYQVCDDNNFINRGSERYQFELEHLITWYSQASPWNAQFLSHICNKHATGPTWVLDVEGSVSPMHCL